MTDNDVRSTIEAIRRIARHDRMPKFLGVSLLDVCDELVGEEADEGTPTTTFVVETLAGESKGGWS